MMNGLLHFFELFHGPFLNVAVLSFLGLIWCGCLFGDGFLMSFVLFSYGFCKLQFVLPRFGLGLASIWVDVCFVSCRGWHRFGLRLAPMLVEVRFLSPNVVVIFVGGASWVWPCSVEMFFS